MNSHTAAIIQNRYHFQSIRCPKPTQSALLLVRRLRFLLCFGEEILSQARFFLVVCVCFRDWLAWLGGGCLWVFLWGSGGGNLIRLLAVHCWPLCLHQGQGDFITSPANGH